jgi:hypothetical protein
MTKISSIGLKKKKHKRPKIRMKKNNNRETKKEKKTQKKGKKKSGKWKKKSLLKRINAPFVFKYHAHRLMTKICSFKLLQINNNWSHICLLGLIQ